MLQAHLVGRASQAVGGFGTQPMPDLCGSGPQGRGVYLDRGAGNGGALVGRECGVAHQEMHLAYRHIQFFSHHLRQSSAQPRTHIHMAMQSGDTGVVPHGQHTLIAFAGKAGHKTGLPGYRCRLRQGRAQDQQYTAGVEKITALTHPLGSHQTGSWVIVLAIKAAAR